MRIFITGATTGIGLELAKNYLSQGHEVALCARDKKKLPENFLEKFPKASFYELSVTNKEALADAVKAFGQNGLDLVIANAGRSHGSKSKLPDFEVAEDIIKTNVMGVLYTFAPAVELMLKQKHGHLVAVASVAGFVGLPGAAAYSSSKAAVLKLCESYYLDLKKFGIHVTAVAPGFIDTPLTRKNDHHMPWLMPVSQAAKTIQKGLAKRKALIVFPWQMHLLISFLDKSPRWLYRKMMTVPLANYSK